MARPISRVCSGLPVEMHALKDINYRKWSQPALEALDSDPALSTTATRPGSPAINSPTTAAPSGNWGMTRSITSAGAVNNSR